MNKLRATERAQISRALARPQPFPLTGDGPAMERVWNRESCMVLVDRCDLAAAVAEARYRDWKAQRDRDAYDARADAIGSYYDGIAEIGRRHRAGEPLHPMFVPTRRVAK